MAKSALVAAGALLAIVGGGALVYGVTRKASGGMTADMRDAMTAAVGQLDSDIKAARATVRERATTFAQLQQVQAAVATDAATAKDMLERGELKFDPEAGEVIELGQFAGGQVTTLLIQPAGGMHSPHAGKPGSFAELMDDRVVVTEVAKVTPKERGGDLAGYVMVTRPLDLAPAIARLRNAGVAGRIELAGQSRAIGTPVAGAVAKEMALPSEPDGKLVVSVPPMSGGIAMPLAAGGGAAAALGLIVLVLGVSSSGARGSSREFAAGTPSPGNPDAPAIAPADLGPGAMIGRWEVIRRLGSGGMADVYLARSRGEAGFEKLVAIKVMHPHLARDERAIEHFLDEARLASRITHPNVVAIQDLGKIGNDYVIVMDYVDGIDLEQLLASARAAARQVPVPVGLAILCRICDGLNAAHTATASDGSPLHLVHRDVKSANVLVSKQGGVKVVDFGIAKAAKQSHLTMAGETKGTPSMMAPEQRAGEQVDVRADVYSVAAVGFEILTGQGVNLDLAALAHLGVEGWPHLPAPSSLRSDLPSELDGILLGAMAFDRERRPADCAALEASLTEVMRRNDFAVSDKDIARWVQGELAALIVAPTGDAPFASRIM